MSNSNRYQIVTHSHECGTDERKDYRTIGQALKDVGVYKRRGDTVFIYDYLQNSVRHAFGGWPHGVFAKDVHTENCIYHW